MDKSTKIHLKATSKYDEASNIMMHLDAIAEEILTIAKKSVRKINSYSSCS